MYTYQLHPIAWAPKLRHATNERAPANYYARCRVNVYETSGGRAARNKDVESGENFNEAAREDALLRAAGPGTPPNRQAMSQ